MTASEKKTLLLPDGRFIGYAEFGDPNGQPIFYFHGFPSSRLEASFIHDLAVANACRIIAVDRPGMGLSSIQENRRIMSWAKDIADTADRLTIEKFSILGYSGGGPFTAACAYLIPNRLNSVAIVSGLAPLENPDAKIGLARGQKIAMRLVKSTPWCASIMMWLTRLMIKHPDRMLSLMSKQLPEVDKVIFRDPQKFNAIINATTEAFNNGTVGPVEEMKMLVKPWGFNLQDITLPITIWHGTLDKQIPISHAKIYANLLPNASLKMIEHEGHYSLIRNQADKIFSTLIMQQ